MELKIISCTQAGSMLQKTKKDVWDLVFSERLKNYGNEYRPMVNEYEVKKLKEEVKS